MGRTFFKPGGGFPAGWINRGDVWHWHVWTRVVDGVGTMRLQCTRQDGGGECGACTDLPIDPLAIMETSKWLKPIDAVYRAMAREEAPPQCGWCAPGAGAEGK